MPLPLRRLAQRSCGCRSLVLSESNRDPAAQAGEEQPTYKCNYRPERIDVTATNAIEFVRGLNKQYGSISTGSDL